MGLRFGGWWLEIWYWCKSYVLFAWYLIKGRSRWRRVMVGIRHQWMIERWIVNGVGLRSWAEGGVRKWDRRGGMYGVELVVHEGR